MRRSRHSAGNTPGKGDVFRASYQPDAPIDYASQPFAEPSENTSWRDDVEANVPPAVPYEDPWRTPFVAQPRESFWQDESIPAHPGYEPLEPEKKRYTGLFTVVLAASLLLIAFLAYRVFTAYQPYPLFLAKAAAMGKNTFFDGIVADGTDISGMDLSKAQAVLSGGDSAGNPRLEILLNVDNTGYRITSEEIPLKRNTITKLEEAWSIGRQGFHWGIGGSKTPFEIRYLHTLQTKRDKAFFATKVSYLYQDARALAESIAAQTTREPINAVIESFNFATKQFSVTRDVPGRKLTAEEVLTPLLSALDTGAYTAQITLASTPILPKVSSVDLQNGFSQLSVFTTKTTSNEDRNFNIALAAQSLNNRTLMPGEVFSFNQSTGERSITKGYRGAPAIYGGVLIDDIGGGVCQVSSTMFNAAALAGLTIVDRSPHAWPSSYVDKGLDATVNWPNLDFKFRNDKDTPVFVISSYKKQAVTIEIYGMRTAPGESVGLETQLMSTTQAPREPLMQPNPSLPPNTTKELKQARTGYLVDTYRVYYRNGAEYRREKLFSSNYRMVQQVIEYN